MPTISWIIERLLTKPVEGSLTDVVITADWRCNGTETTGSGDTAKTYTATCYGSCSFAPPTDAFTPYPDLTQDQVLGWCYANGVDQAAIEANVTQQINDQINPPVVSLPLPWGDAVVDGTTIQAPVIAPVVETTLIEPVAPAIPAAE